MITSRPSRSQVEVRLGSYVDGSERKQVYNWNTCKIAHLRPDMTAAARPKLGRPSRQTTDQVDGPNSTEQSTDKPSAGCKQKEEEVNTKKPAKIQKGPLITRAMFDQWTPELLGLPETEKPDRPVRSTRNPNPIYVDAINEHLGFIGA